MVHQLRKATSYTQRTIKKWLSTIAVYLFLSYLIYVLLFKDRIIEIQNVLSVLGTLAQSNATILAIVISLSLVVIESASRYSARVVDFIKNDSILWEFLLLYFLSIFYPLLLITLITGKTNYFLLHIYFSTAYALSVIAYFSLFYYIRYVFKMIKPSSMIDILSDKNNLKSLSESWDSSDGYQLNYFKNEPRIFRINILKNDETDPLLPITEIISASIKRNDYATVNHGLYVILRCFAFNLEQNPLYEKQMSEHLFDRIFEIWQLALNEKNINCIVMICDFYYRIGKYCTFFQGNSNSSYISSVIKKASKALTPVCNILGTEIVVEDQKQTNLLYTTFLAEYYQKEAFKSIIKIKEDDFSDLPIDLITNLRRCGASTFKNHGEPRTNKQIEALEKSTTEFSEILGEVGIAAINADSKTAVDNIILALNEVGEASIDNNLIHSIFHIVEMLNKIGEESAKKGVEFESSTKQIIECFGKLASRINNHSEELAGETQNKVIEYHKYIKENYEYEGTKYSFKELSNGVELIIRAYISSYIYVIGRESIETNMLNATRQSLKSLETIERILKNGTESRHIAEDMQKLGKRAVEKEQTYPLMKNIINSIYSIGMLQFGYMFDWDRDRDSWNIDQDKHNNFLKRVYSDCSLRGLQSSYSDFVNAVGFEDTEDFCYGAYPDDIIYGERKLIIDEKERKDIKCLNLKDIYDRDPTLKLFKVGVFKTSEKAYYEVPKLLLELTNPILKYTQNLPSDETRKPFDMIIQCFENFGIISIHFRDNVSLKEMSKQLNSIANSFNSLSNSENNKSQNARDNLDCATTVVSRSIYKLAIGSLRYKLVDSSTLYQQMDCLIHIQREYHNLLFDAVFKFECILEMIKESELQKSEREKIITIIENAIEEFKKLK
jgi:hypothetical protein